MTLSVNGLTLSRGPRLLFASLSWKLSSSQAMVLRGNNGSGKTSLLRVLAGLTAPDRGELHWNGEHWTTLCAGQRAASLYLGHANALKDELSAAENLSEALAFDGVSVSSAMQAQALDEMGLAGRHHLPARHFSQGQKRRISLARLKLTKKPLWLLDEPTNALDNEGVALFSNLVGAHLQQGGLACIATHLPLVLGATVNELVLGEAPELRVVLMEGAVREILQVPGRGGIGRHVQDAHARPALRFHGGILRVDNVQPIDDKMVFMDAREDGRHGH